MRRLLLSLALQVWALGVWGQAVSADRTARGVPWAVVELPAGDSELLAAWLPGEAALPAGWAELAAPWGRVAAVEAPSLKAPAQLLEAAASLQQAVAVVLLGPVPRRELVGVLGTLEGAEHRPPPRPSCPWVEGELTVLRGEKEGFLLRLPVPPPEDPRWELGELSAFLLERRWRELGFSGSVRFLPAPCPQLVLEDQGEPARKRLRLARERLGMLAEAVSEEALAAFRAFQEREAGKWAVDPKGLAAAALWRLAWGRPLGPLFFPTTPSPAAAAACLRELVEGRVGSAQVWEREVRPGMVSQETLGNGLVLRVEELASEVGILAVAIAGVEGGVAGEAARALAMQAATAGLPAEVLEVAGMAGVAVVAPGEVLAEQMEAMAAALSSFEKGSEDELREKGVAALGLFRKVRAENLAVFCQLPAGEGEAVEAAHKFFGAIPSAAVSRGRALAPGLAGEEGVGPARVVAFALLPATLSGAALGELLVRRLGALGVEAQLALGVGQLVLAVSSSGATSVAEQDAALERAWENARLVASQEVLEFFRGFQGQLHGAAARAAVRQAMGLFLPGLGSAVLGLEPEEVRQALAALPSYRELPRLGRGPGGGAGQREPARRR